MSDRTLRKVCLVAGIGIGVTAGAALLSSSDTTNINLNLEQHCAMVKLWNETNGDFGWPDYNSTAAQCAWNKY